MSLLVLTRGPLYMYLDSFRIALTFSNTSFLYIGIPWQRLNLNIHLMHLSRELRGCVLLAS